MIKLSKQNIALLSIALLIFISILAVILLQPKNIRPLPNLNKQIISTVSSESNQENIHVIHSRYVSKEWVIATVQFDNEPIESLGRVVTYILHFNPETGLLKSVGFSADSFSRDSVEAGTPDHLIEEANKPW